jgi:hypothetical protein
MIEDRVGVRHINGQGHREHLMQKNAVGGSKNIPLTAEGIIRHM